MDTEFRHLLEVLDTREADVLRFADDLRVPPTSNLAERAVRPAKTQQKISGRLTSEKITAYRYRIAGYRYRRQTRSQDSRRHPGRLTRKPMDAPGSSASLSVHPGPSHLTQRSAPGCRATPA